MNHQDALQQMSVEKYLLGELTGEARDTFEEHLFECQLCAADLKSGVTFLEAARAELAHSPVATPVRRSKPQRFAWLLSPAWMFPALAASLAFLLVQSLVLIPHLHREIATLEQPAILNTVLLAGGNSRGTQTLSVVAPEHGSFLLSVDIPASSAYAAYRCLLVSPSGKQVWQGDVTPEQAKDTVLIHIPTDITQPGQNTFVIQESGRKPLQVLSWTTLRHTSFFSISASNPHTNPRQTN